MDSSQDANTPNSDVHFAEFMRSGDIKHLLSFLEDVKHGRAYINKQDGVVGNTALNWAVFYENEEAVYQLLNISDVEPLRNFHCVGPLQYAIYRENEEILRLLLGNLGGLSPNDVTNNDEPLLAYAIRTKKDIAVRIMQEYM